MVETKSEAILINKMDITITIAIKHIYPGYLPSLLDKSLRGVKSLNP